MGYKFDLDPILAVIVRAVDHLNRFVREISYLVMNAIFMTSKGILEEDIADKFRDFLEKLAPIVATGLGDNWS